MATDDGVLPEGMSALLEVFASELHEVRFGDLDKASLERLAASVRAAGDQLTKAEAAAELARATVEALREEMLQTGQRALAYARIYAEPMPALSEKLQAITLVRRSRRTDLPAAVIVDGTPRRRGRPAKVVSEATGTLALVPADDAHGSAVSAS
jgi:hypothetical protein